MAIKFYQTTTNRILLDFGVNDVLVSVGHDATLIVSGTTPTYTLTMIDSDYKSPPADISKLVNADGVAFANVEALKDYIKSFNGGSAGGGTTPVLSTPTLTSGTPTTTTVPLSWGAVANATGYVLKQSTVNDYSTATQVYSGSGLSYTDSGLSAGTMYYYWLYATAIGYTNSNTSTTNTTTTSAVPVMDYVSPDYVTSDYVS